MAELFIEYCKLKGIGGDVNPEHAFQLFTLASLHGARFSDYFLGKCHAYGVGTKVDPSEAVVCYRRGYDRNCPMAAVSLALCYQHGFGIVRDINQSLIYLLKFPEFIQAKIEWILRIADGAVAGDPFHAAETLQALLLQLQKDVMRSDHFHLIGLAYRKAASQPRLVLPMSQQTEARVWKQYFRT